MALNYSDEFDLDVRLSAQYEQGGGAGGQAPHLPQTANTCPDECGFPTEVTCPPVCHTNHTCHNQQTCNPTGHTCHGATCQTCHNQQTCVPTCQGQQTCDPTCQGQQTCNPTCQTCHGHHTCAGGHTCVTCGDDWFPTEAGPTCAGGHTCVGCPPGGG